MKLMRGEKLIVLTFLIIILITVFLAAYDEAFNTYHEASLQSDEIVVTHTEMFYPEWFAASIFALFGAITLVIYQLILMGKYGLLKTEQIKKIEEGMG